MEQLEFTATENEAGVRIDRCLSDKYEELSRSYLQKLLKEQGVTVNGKAVKANYKIQAGDLVQTTLPDLTEPDILPENIPLDILYEDDDVLVINKPKGMVVHPANGHTSGTLVNAIMYHCQGNLSGINGVMRPGIVHRIDKDTTGALLVCKNDTAHRDLAQQLKAHTIKRRYRAIVAGNLKEDEGTVEGPITQLTGKKWRSTTKMEKTLSPIIKSWNVSGMRLISSAALKPVVPIRSVYI